MLQGKIVFVLQPSIIICALVHNLDTYLAGLGELGAAGVVTVYLDDGFPIAQYGTRWLCQQKFTKGVFKKPNAPPGGIPYFCTNNVALGTTVLQTWAALTQQQLQTGTFTTAAAVTIGNFSVFHDWVPLEDVRSTGFYVYYCLLSIWATIIVFFSCYLVVLGL